MKSLIDQIGSDCFNELANEAVQEAIEKAHAAGLATCHGDREGRIYLLFPDQSIRYFPTNLPKNWLHIWADFQHALFHLIDRAAWSELALNYRAENGAFLVDIAPNVLESIAYQVRELATKYAVENPVDFPKNLLRPATDGRQ